MLCCVISDGYPSGKMQFLNLTGLVFSTGRPSENALTKYISVGFPSGKLNFSDVLWYFCDGALMGK